MEMALKSLGLVHKGLAINHWRVAVDTMKANHPLIDTKQMSIEEAIPAELVPGGEVDLLWASPSCTHHSRAKGGKPRSNQLRAQPELVLTWLDQLFVRRIIIENVPEFVQWGPLGKNGKPIKSKVGACFQKWVEAIEARNYVVEWRIVNCADYGDATSRRRFFLKAVRRGCGRIRWPEPTHAENPETDLWGKTLKKWRGVRECLDLTDLGRSIFEPGRNLALNTLRRVDVGMQKFNGMSFLMDMLGAGEGDESRVHPLTEPMPVQHASGNRCAVVRPFIVKMNHNASAEDIEKPLTTVMSGGQHHALCTPFIVRANRGCYAESVDKPLSSEQAHTVHHALCTPFLVNNNTNNVPKPLDKPAPTLTTGNHAMLCQPVIIDHFKNGEAHSADEPLGAQTTHDRYSVATPFIVEHRKGGKAKPLDGPIGAQTTKDKFSVCTPLILGQNGGAQARPIDEPCPTIATKGAIRLATPVIVDMSRPGGNDSGHIGSADEPIRTITTFDNVQVATPLILDMSHPGDANDERRVASGDEPLRTVTTRNNLAIGTPVIIAQQGGSDVSADKPVPTITTQCRIRVATPVIVDGVDASYLPRLPDGRYLDIRLRMLKPSELAAAHSFPKGYKLTGNRTEQVKQIGNSVPVRTAEAMCRADLEVA
jgi:DNA (cytosine-5)-methyltransferase 1